MICSTGPWRGYCLNAWGRSNPIGSCMKSTKEHVGLIVTVRVFVMLGIYFVSVKYMFVKCKACVRLCETFENLKVQVKKRVFL
jgi:hypothetical protein